MPSTMAARLPAPPSARLAVLLALPLALAGGAATLGAQQPRFEIITRRVASDTSDRAERRLKARADSLVRLYESEELRAAERQRIGDELDRTIEQLERGRSFKGTMRVRLAPMNDPRAAERVATMIAVPRGFLGIVVNGLAREPRVEGGELIVHYLTYPEIITVEPSSPAERAGLEPGDTLIAYDGRDVRDVDISLTRLLRPNARVQVRIARDGRQRDVPVTIADAPSRIVLRAQEMSPASVAGAPGPMSRAGGGFAAAPRAPLPPGASGMRRTMVTTTAPAVPMAPAGLAGAQMGSLTQEWARLTGVSHGVLVLRAPVGSLAAESGLRDADVIVKAAGRTVRTIVELRDLLAIAWENGDRALPIEYVRERKTRSGVLRW
jgi:serine protease Do